MPVPHDPVSAPAHYTRYPVQPIAISRYLGFCLGNAVKYVLRAPYKGGAEDLRKALQYLDWEKDAPAVPLRVRDWFCVEDAMQELAAWLAACASPVSEEDAEGPDRAVASLQAEFLEQLDLYLRRGSRPSWQGMRDAVQDLLRELEGREGNTAETAKD